jgi:hypothetical protein
VLHACSGTATGHDCGRISIAVEVHEETRAGRASAPGLDRRTEQLAAKACARARVGRCQVGRWADGPCYWLEHGCSEGREAWLAESNETCGSSTTRCDPRRGQDRKRKGLRCSERVAMGNNSEGQRLWRVFQGCAGLRTGPGSACVVGRAERRK